MVKNPKYVPHFRSDVFISYRRADTGDIVDRLEPALRNALPGFEIFRDTGGIAPAEKYLEVLQREVERDWVFLAVIGNQWLGDTIDGQRRIDDLEDVLRREVEWRLRGSRPILPVLVDGTSMPKESDLPPRMRGITRMNAVHLRRKSFNSDSKALAVSIKKIVRRQISEQEEADVWIDEEVEKLHGEGGEAPSDLVSTTMGVPVFSPIGSWSLTIASQAAPDVVTGPLGQAELEFTVRDDRSMQGEYRILVGKRLFGGRKFSKHPIEGEAFVFMQTGSTEIANTMHLQGVADGVKRFALSIPVHIKTGRVYIGTDTEGRQYALKLVRGGGGRVGF